MSDFDVAIVGMAGRFPGADSIDELWDALLAGRELTAPRVVAESGETARIALTNTLPDPFAFDAAFFGLRPREAMLTDPQHRVFLECCYHALEHAGYPPGRHDRIVGLFAASYLNTYLLDRVLPFLRGSLGEADLSALVGNEKDHLAPLVAYKLGLRGPAISVQTACSSSLVALHLAGESLCTFQCDLALAGGVTLSLWQSGGYERRDGDLTARDGHCRAYDESASGTVYGNGAAVVVMKRLSDAVADGDTIYAVIKGSAVNNDAARRGGYAAPSVDGQAEVIERALSMAGISPDRVAFIEGHGTGTRLGDEIEVEALHRVFARSARAPRGALGSLKANVGHLGVASGVAGVIKASLALFHRVLPPQINVHAPIRRLRDAGAPLQVHAATMALPPGEIVAGVSSFGLGGTNAHVVLTSAPVRAETVVRASPAAFVLPFSARTPRALRALLERMATALPALSPTDLRRAGVTLQRHRDVFPVRQAVVATRDGAGLAEALHVALRQAVRAAEASERPQVVFLLPSSAPTHEGGRGEAPAVAARVAEILAEGARSGRVLPPSAAGFAAQVALVERLVACGVAPTMLVGDAEGELAALFVAGVLSLDRCLAALGSSAARGPIDLAAWVPMPAAAPSRYRVLLADEQALEAGDTAATRPMPRERQAGWYGGALLRLAASGALFVEVGGPGPFSALYEMYRTQLAALDFLCLPVAAGDDTLARVLAAAFRAGCDVRWPAADARPLPLPGYPFERGRYEITAKGEAVHRPLDLDRVFAEREGILRDLWLEIFGATDVAEDDTLYEHGAESLSIAIYARALRRLFGLEIALTELHAIPTFGAHIRVIGERLSAERRRPAPPHALGEPSAV